jgi:hypothetical protein
MSRLQKNKWRDENSEPRRLKPAWFWTAGGTTEVVPFHKAFPKAASQAAGIRYFSQAAKVGIRHS